MSSLLSFIEPYHRELLVAIAALAVILLALVMTLWRRLSDLSRLAQQWMTREGNETLESMLQRNLEENAQINHRLGEIERALQRIAQQQTNCLQRIGIVRYDAFGDVSGMQSFSLAILDAHNTGVIITGLFGRSDARCYSKSVRGGRPEFTLTEEEEQAMRMAMTNS